MSLFTCKSIVCKVGGGEVSLCFNFRALALIQKATGRNVLVEGLPEMDPESLTLIFWASAVQEQPELTLEEVRGGSLMDAAAMLIGINAAWRAANDMPDLPDRPTNGLEETASPACVVSGN